MAVGFLNCGHIRNLGQIDTVKVLLKSTAGKFSPHFDHAFEERPTFIG
jgi:hypothetical protein